MADSCHLRRVQRGRTRAFAGRYDRRRVRLLCILWNASPYGPDWCRRYDRHLRTMQPAGPGDIGAELTRYVTPTDCNSDGFGQPRRHATRRRNRCFVVAHAPQRTASRPNGRLLARSPVHQIGASSPSLKRRPRVDRFRTPRRNVRCNPGHDHHERRRTAEYCGIRWTHPKEQ